MMTKQIVLDALLLAVWRKKPTTKVMVHSDQGSQYTSYKWQSFLAEHGLEGSMSRRGNYQGNPVAESFFQLLKRERIKKLSTQRENKQEKCASIIKFETETS
jgi:putative transposase